jgi:hypothetical protein
MSYELDNTLDLIDQLEKKRKIKLAHWNNIEGFMTTKFL